MFKADLKVYWGDYCDTDKLVDDMMALLTKYHHRNTEEGVCEIIHRYFVNKRELIDLFKQSENYIGNMRICLDVELYRTGKEDEVYSFVHKFSKAVGAEEIFIKRVDEDGKTLDDYTRTGVGRFKARALQYGDVREKLQQNQSKKERFNHDGTTKASHEEMNKFHNKVCCFDLNHQPTMQEYTAELLRNNEQNVSFAVGMKTSRAFNRLCSHYGIDKLPQYNRLFAQYADMVSGLKRKLKFYISLNPLDYLTMSFGNSWASCHTIDKLNERGMQNSYRGMYCGGTLSYMLDGTSIITYVHDHATENHEEGKIYRNMFHYGNSLLVQGRIYPQGNDGATDLYREFRRIVQGELARLLHLEEDEWIKRTCGCGENTSTTGVHYADYLNFSECNVSYPSETPEVRNNVVRIGHKRICPDCGCYVNDDEEAGYLGHVDCGF